MFKRYKLLLPLFLLCAGIQAQSSYLDPAFGKLGWIRPPVGNANYYCWTRMVLQPDGRIVVREERLQESGINKREFWLHRFLPNGRLDTLFGAKGSLLLNPGEPDGQTSYGDMLQLLPDGKILAGYRALVPGSNKSVIVRLMPDGSPDTGFGGDGRVDVIDQPPLDGQVPLIHDLVQRSDGRVLLLYFSNTYLPKYVDYGYRLLEPDGAIQPPFDSVHWLSTPDREEVFRRVLFLPGDGLLLSGASKPLSADNSLLDLEIRQLLPDFRTDSAFGSAGALLTELSGGADYNGDMLRLPNGNILCSAYSNQPDHKLSFAQFLPDGSPDPAFGNGGQRSYSQFIAGPQYPAIPAFALASAPGDRFVTLGQPLGNSGPSEGAVARFFADGSPDTTFSASGRVYLPNSIANAFVFLQDIVVRPDGRIVACGQISDSIRSLVLVQVLPQGNATVWYRDEDGDGYGTDLNTLVAEDQPGGFVAAGGDCDDANNAVNPAMPEICNNGIDDNCNGSADEDNAPPIALCIGNLSLDLDEQGMVSIPVAALDNGSFDACSSIWFPSDTLHFSCSDIDLNNLVTLQVLDAAFNASACQTAISVRDLLPPVVACADTLALLLDDTGLLPLSPQQIGLSGSDNCQITSGFVQPSQLSVADLGLNTITLTVSDASGNTASCHTIVQLTETIGTAETPAMPLLRLSPNPVAGLLQWQVLGAGDFSSARLLVSDAQGRLLLSQSAVFQQAVPATLDTSALPAGVYLLSLFGDAGLVARARFCKQ